MEISPFYTEHVITKDVYGVEEDAYTLALMALFVVSAEMCENDVYYMTKALFENAELIASLHAKGAYITLESAFEGVMPGTVHPGAARFYAERGIIVP